MLKHAMGFRRMAPVLVLAALGSMWLRTGSAYAAGPSDPPPPPAGQQLSNERLELIWAREQDIHDRMALHFEHADQRIALAQSLIDKAKANGKDVTVLQAALDDLAAAIKAARPVFEGTQGILASHKGFDANGKVTDAAAAQQTVRELGEKLKEVRSTLMNPWRAFREALRNFRQANKRQPAVTPVP